MEFKEAYKQLNKAQKEAVDAIEGPVMVVAGPGTGKTQILTLRIANILLKTDTPASGILALTFTDAGAKEMKRRLRDIIGSRADEVRVHTYHSFAGSIISEFDDHFPHLSRTKQITEIEAEALIRDILKEKRFAKLRPYGDPDFYLAKILGAISDAKKEAWTSEMVRSFARDEIGRVETNEEWKSTRGPTKGKLKAEGLRRIEKCKRTIIFADAYEAYEARKKSERKIDFDDLIFELGQALRADELLLHMLQEKFLYLLIDEHQDTNDSQNAIIRLIADFFESPNLFVVGDEKQAIYRFQGASVENFLKFQNLWKSMRVIQLTENYRSGQKILDAGFAMIEQNYAEGEHQNLRVKLHAAGKKSSEPVEIASAKNIEASEEYLAAELKKILIAKPDASIALIVRRNRDVSRLLELCENNDIPAAAERGADIFSHPIGALFFNLIEFLADPGQIESLALTIASGLWDLPLDKVATLVRGIRSGTVKDIEKDILALTKLKEEISRHGALGYLVLAAELSGLETLVLREHNSTEVWRAIVSLARNLAASQQLADDPRALIKTLLDYRTSAEKKVIKLTSGSALAHVRIMTAHGSKGLEFDYVFLPYATEESWLPRGRGNYFILPHEKAEGDEIRDARRLFYVALTRARNQATILVPLEDNTERQLTRLRFLDELDSGSVETTVIPHAEPKLKTGTRGSRDSRRQTEALDYAKRVLTENGLSPTALNHFCECPAKFYYKSILKLPEPPSSSAEKGNAMHEAMARVWHLKDKSVENVSATIKLSVSEYIAGSLLPSFEKEPLLEELIAAAPIVAAALHDHVNQSGEILTESWHERDFPVVYKKEKVVVPLHGKLDALLTTDADVQIFDYKTREGMSENAIRGRTQDSDGGYFRQLVFYRMLVADNSKFKNKSIQTALVFVKPDSKGRCQIALLPVTKEDIANVEAEIKKLIESVWSGKLLSFDCKKEDCEYCALLKIMQ